MATLLRRRAPVDEPIDELQPDASRAGVRPQLVEADPDPFDRPAAWGAPTVPTQPDVDDPLALEDGEQQLVEPLGPEGRFAASRGSAA